jgi:hypothetical protein
MKNLKSSLLLATLIAASFSASLSYGMEEEERNKSSLQRAVIRLRAETLESEWRKPNLKKKKINDKSVAEKLQKERAGLREVKSLLSTLKKLKELEFSAEFLDLDNELESQMDQEGKYGLVEGIMTIPGEKSASGQGCLEEIKRNIKDFKDEEEALKKTLKNSKVEKDKENAKTRLKEVELELKKKEDYKKNAEIEDKKLKSFESIVAAEGEALEKDYEIKDLQKEIKRTNEKLKAPAAKTEGQDNKKDPKVSLQEYLKGLTLALKAAQEDKRKAEIKSDLAAASLKALEADFTIENLKKEKEDTTKSLENLEKNKGENNEDKNHDGEKQKEPESDQEAAKRKLDAAKAAKEKLGKTTADMKKAGAAKKQAEKKVQALKQRLNLVGGPWRVENRGIVSSVVGLGGAGGFDLILGSTVQGWATRAAEAVKSFSYDEAKTSYGLKYLRAPLKFTYAYAPSFLTSSKTLGWAGRLAMDGVVGVVTGVSLYTYLGTWKAPKAPVGEPAAA